MAQRIEVLKVYQIQEPRMRRLLEYCSVASSTWYSCVDKKIETDGRKNNKGRPLPGYTKTKSGTIKTDAELVEILQSYRQKKENVNACGYHKLTHHLRRDHQCKINPKKVYRLCRENNILLPRITKRRRRKDLISLNRIVKQPNEVWELDLKYGYIHGENKFFFILGILDVYTRLLVNYYIGLRCCGKDVVYTLKAACEKYKIDDKILVIRTDRGTQMTSGVFERYIEERKGNELVHELIPPATPNKNAHIESFNSIIELEFLLPRYFKSYGQAYEETVDFMEHYNSKRIHGSLRYRTPNEIYADYCNGVDLKLKDVKI